MPGNVTGEAAPRKESPSIFPLGGGRKLTLVAFWPEFRNVPGEVFNSGLFDILSIVGR